MRPRSKKPGAVSRPGGWRNFGEYAFLEDSRYTSQEGRERTCILRLLRRQSLNLRQLFKALRTWPSDRPRPPMWTPVRDSSCAGLIRSLDVDIVPEADPVIDLFHRCARRLIRPGG